MTVRSFPSLVAIATLLLGSVLAFGPSSAQAKPAVTFPTKPLVGACQQWTYSGASHGYRGRSVPCGRRHNVITVAVPTAPRSLAGLDATQIDALEASTCEPLLLKHLGRTAVRRETSAYRLFVAHPSAAQIARGERWFECEVALGAGRRLLPLPAQLSHPILPKRADDATERCLTGRHLDTTCASKHAYRPIGSITFKRAAYPSADEFFAAAAACPDRTRWVTWGSEISWNVGDRVLVCYAKTTT